MGGGRERQGRRRAWGLAVLLLAGAVVVGAPNSAAACGKSGSYTAVWQVQGTGQVSPLEGAVLQDVRGVVTSDLQRDHGGPDEPDGFFLQAHEPDCDATTSDGVFVYTGSSVKSVQVGDLVRLRTTTVAEYQGPGSFRWDLPLTELDCRSACTVSVLQAGHGLPAALDLDPPRDAAASAAYHEAREGMLVEVRTDVTVVTGTSPFHEVYALRGAGRERPHVSDGPHGDRIMVNGGSVTSSGCGEHGLGDLHTFDRIPWQPSQGVGVAGPLSYGFNAWKVLADPAKACPVAQAGDRSSYDPAHGMGPPDGVALDRISLASWNVENLFDTQDDPYKNDPVPTQAELDHQLAKLASVVCNDRGLNRPAILALQEVENLNVLSMLAAEVRAACGVTYLPHLLDGPDGRGIDVGFLTRVDRVVPIGLEAVQGCSARDRGVDYEFLDHRPLLLCGGSRPHLLHSRPPLALSALVATPAGVHAVHVLNNHFKSKLSSSNCDDADCTDWRLEEAAHVRAWVEARLALDPESWVVVVGDLNDHRDSAVVQALVASGPDAPLRSTWDDLAGPPGTGQGTVARYSYLFQGVAQELDHVLVSPGLDAVAREVLPRHLSRDWPASLADEDGMFHASDHDPVVVVLRPAA